MQLMSPCYVIIAGGSRPLGAIVTRDEFTEQRRKEIGMVNDSSDHKTANKRVKRRKGKNKKKVKTPQAQDEKKQTHALSSNERSRVHILVQANMDHWINDPDQDDSESLVRVYVAESMLTKLMTSNHKKLMSSKHNNNSSSNSNDNTNNADANVKKTYSAITHHDLWRVLCTDPIWEDSETIYATVMCPAENVYESTTQQLQFHPDAGFTGIAKLLGQHWRKLAPELKSVCVFVLVVCLCFNMYLTPNL